MVLVPPQTCRYRGSTLSSKSFPLINSEPSVSTAISPLQAGLSWVVKLQKEISFIGQKQLQLEAKSGPARLLRAYKVRDRRIARQGYPIFNQTGNQVGQITSGTHSPHLEAPIALALIDKESAEDSSLWVDIRGSKILMNREKLPFIPSHTKKT
ncbi:MAG: hypothetical protein EB038_03970 [Cyclobacteriaceae bacterium]|nr:hypothetical protein [Cyclobacteriaceae bacterium]